MNRVLKLISGIVASVTILAIGFFMYAVVAGFIIDEKTHVEDDPLPNTVEISNTDIVAGGSQGIINWRDDYGSAGSVMFNIYTSGDFSYIEESSRFPENVEDGRETLDEAVYEFMEEQYPHKVTGE